MTAEHGTSAGVCYLPGSPGELRGSAGTAPEVAAIDGQLFGFLLGAEHMHSLAEAHDVHCWLQWAQDGLDAGHAGQQQAIPCAGPCTHGRTLHSSPDEAGQTGGGGGGWGVDGGHCNQELDSSRPLPALDPAHRTEHLPWPPRVHGLSSPTVYIQGQPELGCRCTSCKAVLAATHLSRNAPKQHISVTEPAQCYGDTSTCCGVM